MRLLYFATTRSPAFADPLIDADYYDYLGLRLASGQGFEAGPFWQPPLYPLVLSVLYAAFGHDLVWPRLLQACLDGLTAAMVSLTAAALTASRSLGLAAGLAIALYGPMVFYSGEILPTTAAACCSMLAIRYSLAARPSTARCIASGASVGAGALLVPPVLAMIAPIGWLLGRERGRSGVLTLAACFAVVGCATFANWKRANELVLISANAGINLYIGNARDSDRLVAIRPGAGWETLVAEPVAAGIATASGQDRYFARRALAACTSDPIACVLRLSSKARQLAASREIPRNEQLELIARDAWVLRVLTPRVGSAVLPFAVLLPLSAAGIVVALRRRRREHVIVVLTVAAMAATIVLFFVTGRYRIPLVPGLTVLAAVGAQALARGVRQHVREASAAAAAFALAVLPLQLPIDAVPFEAEMHYAIGGRRARLGDDAGAVAAWSKAVQLRPGHLEAGVNLGLALERLGHRELAAAAYRNVLRSHPGAEQGRPVCNSP